MSIGECKKCEKNERTSETGQQEEGNRNGQPVATSQRMQQTQKVSEENGREMANDGRMGGEMESAKGEWRGPREVFGGLLVQSGGDVPGLAVAVTRRCKAKTR